MCHSSYKISTNDQGRLTLLHYFRCFGKRPTGCLQKDPTMCIKPRIVHELYSYMLLTFDNQMWSAMQVERRRPLSYRWSVPTARVRSDSWRSLDGSMSRWQGPNVTCASSATQKQVCQMTWLYCPTDMSNIIIEGVIDIGNCVVPFSGPSVKYAPS